MRNISRYTLSVDFPVGWVREPDSISKIVCAPSAIILPVHAPPPSSPPLLPPSLRFRKSPHLTRRIRCPAHFRLDRRGRGLWLRLRAGRGPARRAVSPLPQAQ